MENGRARARSGAAPPHVDLSAGDAGYEPFETRPDIGIHAWGPTRAESFVQTALGVFALIAAPGAVEPRDIREVRAQGQTPETLLVNWINECLYVHEIEGFVVQRVEVDTCADGLVHGTLHGEEFNEARHRPGTVVKAATLHGVQVAQEADRWTVSVVVDV